jgi:nucleotide-binding universal stress UspA family protein
MKALVAVDKSPESGMALRYACHLFEHLDVEVDALYVRPDESDIAPETFYAPFVEKSDVRNWIESETEKVEEQVLDSCEICYAGSIPCKPRVVVGDPAEEILNSAITGDYDLIVLGSQGKSGLRGLLLGAVHAKILHHARQPVLLVRNFRPVQRVLVAYRGSQCDQGALEFIAPLFIARMPEITVLHVQETSIGESDEFAQTCLLRGDQTLRKFEHAPVTKMAKGDFVDEILKEVATERYDLVVLGAYGHRRPKYLKVLSDEALNLVRLTTRPVLVYREKTSVKPAA